MKRTPSLWPEDRKLLTWDTSCTCLLLSSFCWNSRHCQLHCHCVMTRQKFSWHYCACTVCVYPSHCCHNLTDWSTDSTPASLLCWNSSALTLAQIKHTHDSAFSTCIHNVMERNLRQTLEALHKALRILTRSIYSPSHKHVDDALIIPSINSL